MLHLLNECVNNGVSILVDIPAIEKINDNIKCSESLQKHFMLLNNYVLYVSHIFTREPLTK